MKTLLFVSALVLVGCAAPPPPYIPPPPPPMVYQPPPPPPMYTEAPVTTMRRHSGVTTVTRRCPAGMHWVSSRRKVTTYQQGDRTVKVSKKKSGYCSN